MKTDALVATFYKFLEIPHDQLDVLVKDLEAIAADFDIRGLIIMGVEGFNATISGADENVHLFCEKIFTRLNAEDVFCKYSRSSVHPFRKFKVKLRDEIVTLGRPDYRPNEKDPTHLSPTEWDRVLKEEDVLVIDTRNWYETRVGKFKQALDPNIEEFQEFPDYVKNANFPKDKKVLIYCTGGIRCEKAIIEMHNQGFENVFQLEGGILNYLEQFPHQEFEGECFVFDHRVAVDQELRPTQNFKMCPHCGQPATQKLDCLRCDTPTIVCETCSQKEELKTCSKNCAHHYGINGRKGRRQAQGYRFEVKRMKLQNKHG